jgi:hypothetical protein
LAVIPPSSERKEKEISRIISVFILDVEISVGYWVKSSVGLEFRRWFNPILFFRFLIKDAAWLFVRDTAKNN